MKLSFHNLIRSAFLAMFLMSASAALAVLSPGDHLPDLDGQDQHEVAYPVPAGTRYVAVAFTMGVGKDANRFLEKKGAAYLPEHKAVFVANIHGMPKVGRIFAMPKMRKYPHRILLADEEGLLDEFPQQDGRVTVFKLDANGVIESVAYWNPEEADSEPFGG